MFPVSTSRYRYLYFLRISGTGTGTGTGIAPMQNKREWLQNHCENCARGHIQDASVLCNL
jgi:hypothetical protein